MEDLIHIVLNADHTLECADNIIGRSGEGNTTKMTISIPEDLRNHSAYLDFKRPNGEKIRTPKLSIDNGVATYSVEEYLLIDAGEVEVQVIFLAEDGQTWKSYPKKFINAHSINAIEDIPNKESVVLQLMQAVEHIAKGGEEIADYLANNESFRVSVSEKAIKEVAKKVQLYPEYANSVDECTDTSRVYVLPDGYIYGYTRYIMQGGTKYTNLVPTSVDTDGSIYNGVGYKENVRLSSVGGVSSEAQNGSVTTGFIPFTSGNTIRIKGVEFIGAQAKYSGHYYINFYSEDKQTCTVSIMEGAIADGTGSCTTYSYDETSNITTINVLKGVTTTDYGKGVDKASWIRITARGSGENFILTVNEEIEDYPSTIEYEWRNTGHAFVPADYEGRIVAAEHSLSEVSQKVDNVDEKVNGILKGTTEIATAARFDPTVYDLPVLYLEGDTTPILSSKDNEVELSYRFGERSGTCKLKGQGASSYNMAKAFVDKGKAGKFNYTIKFDNAFEAKEGTIFEPNPDRVHLWYEQQWWGEQKKYCLKANWIDHTHARNVVSAKIWGGIVKSRKKANEYLNALPCCGAVDGFPIVIVLNGTFHGLYTFNIPKDGWMFGLKEDSTKTQAMLGANDHETATQFKGELAGDESDFELEFVSDKNNKGWVTTSLNRLINACVNSNGTDLDTTVAKYLDWDSAIDYYIYTVVIRGEDMVDKNFLITTLDGTKWFFTVYDMDSTYGLAWDASRLNRPVSDINFVACANTNRVFELIKNYKKSELKSRYAELRNDILSESRMAQTFENFAWDIPAPVKMEDVKKYPTIRGSSVNTIDQIGRWLRQRLETCDKWMNEL